MVTDRPRRGIGDYLVLHDAGAYGSSMSSNYNTGRWRLKCCWTKARLIRRRQTVADLLALES